MGNLNPAYPGGGNGASGGGIPNPDSGVLAPNEMVKSNADGTAIVGTGDTNTDTEVNFGVKNLITQGIVGAGSGTFRLGDAHDDSSAGENKVTTNRVSNIAFNPVWVNQEANKATSRFTVGVEQELTQEPSKADVLVNPSWISNPIVDWRVVKLTFEAETTQTNCVFSVFKNGQDFYSSKLDTLTADVEQEISLKVKSADGSSRAPVDAFAVDTYTVSVTSSDGDVRLKGSLANGLPFFKVGYFEFEDFDIFDMDNMADGLSKVAMTVVERTNLSNQSGTNTGDQDLSGLALKSNVLELDNTDAFTPDADYEPATKKYVDDNAGGVFGNGWQSEENGATRSTTSSSFQQAQRLTTPSLPAGTYRIGIVTLHRVSSTSGDVVVRVQVNDSTTLFDGESFRKEAKDSGSDQRENYSGFDYYTGSGVLNIDVDYARGSDGTAYMYYTRIEIWRVS